MRPTSVVGSLLALGHSSRSVIGTAHPGVNNGKNPITFRQPGGDKNRRHEYDMGLVIGMSGGESLIIAGGVASWILLFDNMVVRC